MNRYPLWKYVIIGLVALASLLYAAPILYPSDHAIKLSSAGSTLVTEQILEEAKQALDTNKVSFKSIVLHENEKDDKKTKVLIRFTDSDTQLQAIKIIRKAFDEEEFTASLNLAPTTPAWLRAINAKPMYMGLDLRGGVHFLMEVDMPSAIKKALNNYKDSFRSGLIKKEIKYAGIVAKENRVEIIFKNQQDFTIGRDIVAKIADGDFELSSTTTDRGVILIATMKQKTIATTKTFALKQNITTLRNRVNELGVSEPTIQQQGVKHIVVQLPGIQDIARAKNILGATATLEFHKVDTEHSAFDAKQSGRAPKGARLYKASDGSPVLLHRRTIIAGEHITGASAGFDSQNNTPSVNLKLNGIGAKRMLAFTSQNVGEPMGVVFIETKSKMVMVDGVKTRLNSTKKKVINQATIREPFGSSFQITGLDSSDEAHDLAVFLRAGTLAAPVYIVEERTVGPSLGQANIDAGFKSVVLGFVLVLIFMAVYYKVFGLVANIALALNLVVIIAVLSLMQAVLTLPGIAGIVLTVGMAVDANVLIYERIKEELRNGISPQSAINAGYEKALSTIADANITTLIAATVLFTFGTGPIKGFAITLAIGILSSMFTAIMGTRAVINLIYGRRKVTKIAI